MAQAIRNDNFRMEAIAALVPWLAPNAAAAQWMMLERAPDLAADALIRLAERSELGRLPGMLAATERLWDNVSRVRAIAAIFALSPAQLGEPAFEAACGVTDPSGRALLFSDLAPRFPIQLIEQALEAGLAAAADIHSSESRAAAIAALVDQLPYWPPSQALTLTEAIPDGRARSDALAALAPRLPQELIPAALKDGRDAAWRFNRAEPLAAVAPRLLPDQVPEAMVAASELAGNERAVGLAALAPLIYGELFSWALETAHSIGPNLAPAEALAALAGT